MAVPDTVWQKPYTKLAKCTSEEIWANFWGKGFVNNRSVKSKKSEDELFVEWLADENGITL